MRFPADRPWNLPPSERTKCPESKVHGKSANQGNEVAYCNITGGNTKKGKIYRPLADQVDSRIYGGRSQLHAKKQKEHGQRIQPEWIATRLYNPQGQHWTANQHSA